MTFHRELAEGWHGVSLTLPPELEVVEHGEHQARVVDPARGVVWYFLFFGDVGFDLDPANADRLARDAGRQTRALFDFMFEQGQRQGSIARDQEPRTADATWTPLVELEPRELDGGRALRVVHRMAYRPGAEIVMGHLLAPVVGGLFEARWLANAAMTGIRESILSLREGHEATDPHPGQAFFDDPAHDAQFPDHPLSRVRAAARWIEGAIRVRKPASPIPAGPATLGTLGCTIVSPPRFVAVGASGGRVPGHVFTRASFAGSDALERLAVLRYPDTIRGFATTRRLARFARAEASRWETPSHLPARDVEVEIVDGGVEVLTRSEARSGEPMARGAALFFLDPGGVVWSIGQIASISTPLDELRAELAAVVASWRAT